MSDEFDDVFDDEFGDIDSEPEPTKKKRGKGLFSRENKNVSEREKEDELLRLYEEENRALLSDDEESSPNPFKRKSKRPKREPTQKKSFLKRFFSDEEDEDDENEEVNNSTQENQGTWNVISHTDMLENEEPEIIEDKVEIPEREIGKVIKTELSANEARGLDLSFRDRWHLLQQELTKEERENEQFDKIIKEEETRINHVVTLKNWLYATLKENLHTSTQEATVTIDAKFGPYLAEVMEEISLSYYVAERPRNLDIVNLNPSLPYRFSFQIKSL